jgi:hypothetical protein
MKIQDRQFARVLRKRLTKEGLRRTAKSERLYTVRDRPVGGGPPKYKPSRKKALRAARKTANKKPKPTYWKRLKREMHILICTNDQKYARLRRQVSKGTSQRFIVSTLTAGIAATLGKDVALVTPFVLIVLSGFLEVGGKCLVPGGMTCDHGMSSTSLQSMPCACFASAAVPKVGQWPSGWMQSGAYCIDMRRC